MEDRVQTCLLSSGARKEELKITEAALFVGVYDGHGGNQTAKFLADKVHLAAAAALVPQPQEQKRDAVLDEDRLGAALIELDAEFLRTHQETKAGSCMIFAVVRPNENQDEFATAVANVGDSRALLLRRYDLNSGGSSSSNQNADHDCEWEDLPQRPGDREARVGYRFKMLSADHKPSLDEEQQRIEAAGGFVSDRNRVDGLLAVSRAFGDKAYKQSADKGPREQKVIVVPDVRREMLYPGDALLVCCDGLVSKLSNTQVAAFVAQKLEDGRQGAPDPALICSQLIKHSLASDSHDNHTAVLLVAGVDGRTYTASDELLPKSTPPTDDEELPHTQPLDEETVDALKASSAAPTNGNPNAARKRKQPPTKEADDDSNSQETKTEPAAKRQRLMTTTRGAANNDDEKRKEELLVEAMTRLYGDAKTRSATSDIVCFAHGTVVAVEGHTNSSQQELEAEAGYLLDSCELMPGSSTGDFSSAPFIKPLSDGTQVFYVSFPDESQQHTTVLVPVMHQKAETKGNDEGRDLSLWAGLQARQAVFADGCRMTRRVLRVFRAIQRPGSGGHVQSSSSSSMED